MVTQMVQGGAQPIASTARSEVNTISACIPENMQEETLWLRVKKLTLNVRSVLNWILASNNTAWMIPLFFAEQNLQGQSVNSDDVFNILEQFSIYSLLCFLFCFLSEATSLNVFVSDLCRDC